MRTLIIGATGCLGTALTRYLHKQRHYVTSMGRSANKEADSHLEVDLTSNFNPKSYALEKYDFIYYLAQSHEYRNYPSGISSTYKTNTSAALKLASVAYEMNAKFIYASTGSVYAPSQAELDEKSPLINENEFNLYNSSKIAAEKLLDFLGDKLRISRPFFIYGEKAHHETLIPKLFRKIEAHEPIQIQGREGLIFNPIFSEDAAEAIHVHADADNLTLNISGSEIVSLKALSLLIGRAMGVEPKFDYVAEQVITRIVSSTQELRKLGFNHKFSLEEGISKYMKTRN
jgi:nucleoside-diphosphate-sugar epimerase